MVANLFQIFSHLNTSHVKVKPLVSCSPEGVLNYLNTSHVKVKRSPLSFPPEKATNLNTSHVKVKRKTISQQDGTVIFKYISC